MIRIKNPAHKFFDRIFRRLLAILLKISLLQEISPENSWIKLTSAVYSIKRRHYGGNSKMAC